MIFDFLFNLICGVILLVISAITLIVNSKYSFKLNIIKSAIVIWVLMNIKWLIDIERFGGGFIDLSFIFVMLLICINIVIVFPISLLLHKKFKNSEKDKFNDSYITNKSDIIIYLIATIVIFIVSVVDVKIFVNSRIKYSFFYIDFLNWFNDFLIPRFIIYYIATLLIVSFFNIGRSRRIFYIMAKIILITIISLLISIYIGNTYKEQVIVERKYDENKKIKYNLDKYTVEYANNEILKSIQKQYKEKLKIERVIPMKNFSGNNIAYEALVSFVDKPQITFQVWRNYPEYKEVIDMNYNITISKLELSDKYDDEIQSFFNSKVYAQMYLVNNNQMNMNISIVTNDKDNIDKELISLYNMLKYFKNIKQDISSILVSFDKDEESALKSTQYRKLGFKALSIGNKLEITQLVSYKDLINYCYEPIK